jgi:hypothetical protein
MKAQVLKGSKQDIAETVVRISGDVGEAIVFVEETSDPAHYPAAEDIFAEMESFTVKVGGADYAREALYARMEGRWAQTLKGE